MGFRFSSFVAGAAENLTETLKEDEKQAAAAASFGVKALKEQYDKVQAENRTLADDLSKKVKFLEKSDPTATQAQLFAAATNDVYMSAVMEAAKNNPGSFRVADVVKIKEGNESQGTALDMIKAYTAMPEISQAARQAEGVAVPEKPQGLFGIGTLRNRAAASAGSRAEEQTAKAMGVSIEQLRAASGYKRPEIKTGAEFDYTSLQKPKSFKDTEDEAKVLVFNAEKSGDPNLIKAANVVATSIKKTNEAFSSEQKQFTKTLDDARTVLLSPTKYTPEEVKEANNVYNNYINMERRKAVGTKVSDAKDDTPKIGALNSFVSGAVAKELIATFGTQIKNGDITFTPNASGEVTANVLMTDMGERFKVAGMQYEAAKRALAIYSDPKTGEPISNDGKAVLAQYKAALDRAREQYKLTDAGKAELGAQQSTPPPPPAASEAAVKPAPAATPAQSASPVKRPKPANAPPDAKQAPDGHWYSKNDQTGKYIKWSN